jgi:adenosine deaminase
MFGTSLQKEFTHAAQCFDLSRETLTGLCGNAVEASFLHEKEKEILRGKLRVE